MTKVVKCAFTKRGFLDNYLHDLVEGGIFIATDEYFGLEEKVSIHLAIDGLCELLRVNGKIAWHRRPRTWRSSLKAGIGFEFDHLEGARRDFLLKFCDGTAQDRRFSGPRAQQEFVVEFMLGDKWRLGKASNVGEGGVFVRADETPVIGETVKMKLFMEGLSDPADCAGLPIWHSTSDSAAGFGAKFKTMGAGLRRHLSTIPPPAAGKIIAEKLRGSVARNTLQYGHGRKQ